MELIKKTKENKTRYALLGILTERECTGYDMKKIMEESLIFFWQESFGQIYPTLKQMEAEGLVQVREQLVGQKIRYLYHITNKGWEELRAWLATPPAPEIIRNELLLKLFFSQQQNKQVVLEHLKRQRQYDLHLLGILEQKRIQLNSQSTPPNLFRLLTLEYGLRALRAELDWLNFAEEQIAAV